MLRTSHKLTLLFLSTFLYVNVAEAGLSRGSGRGDYSDNFQQAFYYVDNSLVNSIGITDAAHDNFYANSTTKGVGGGGRGLGSVPSECINGWTQDEVDALEAERNSRIYALPSDNNYDDAAAAINNDIDQQLQTLTVGEPCAWEFNQGEDLFTFGFFSLDFGTPDVSYAVNWQIAGNGGLWSLAGSVDNGSVFLDTTAPVNLFAGDYSIRVSVGISSTKGSFFWENDDARDPVVLTKTCPPNPAYDDYYSTTGAYETWLTAYNNWFDGITTGPEPIQPPEPAQEICGWVGLDENDERSNPPTFFYSDPEILRILAVNSDPVGNAVNAPASLGTFLLGLGALFMRRRARLKNDNR
jgi:hypothetical protein